MISLRAIPMVRLAVPYCVGIGLASHFSLLTEVDFLLCGLLLGLVGLFFLSKSSKIASQTDYFFGLGLVSWLVLFGFWRYHASDSRNLETSLGKHQGINKFLATVAEPPKMGNWWKIPISVQAVQCDSTQNWAAASGKIMVMLDSSLIPASGLAYGDQLVFFGKPQPVLPPANPQQFDFRAYMAQRGVHHQIFVQREPPVLVAREQGSALWRVVYKLRARVLNTLSKHLKSEDTYSVGAAILLGYKDELSDEARRSFVETGTMHILAVSGAHVGILYGCLRFFLGFIPFVGRRWQWFEALFLLGIIWGFVLITGASEPAVRAAFMFSLYSSAKLLHRDQNVYNVLGLSAFIMLLYEPRMLFSIGFQLSFLAVLGIALFWKPFCQIIPQKWPKWPRYIAELVLLGCAAQLSILPLTLYYFHQLPTLFWLSGTLAIPFATAYIWGAVALLTIGQIEWIGYPLGVALDFILKCMVAMLKFSTKIPGHLIDGIWLSPWMAWSLSVSVAALAYLIIAREKKAIWLALGGVLMVGIGRFSHFWTHKNQEIITAYSLGKNMLLDGFVGWHGHSRANDIPLGKQIFAAQNNRFAHEVRLDDALISEKTTGTAAIDTGPFFIAGKKKLIVIDCSWSGLDSTGFVQKTPIEAIYFRKGGSATDLPRLMRLFETKTVLCDGSLGYHQSKDLANICAEMGLNFHDLVKNGYWTSAHDTDSDRQKFQIFQ